MVLKTFIPHVRKNGGNVAAICDGCGQVCAYERVEKGGAWIPGTNAWFCHQYCLHKNRARGMIRWEDDQARSAAIRTAKNASKP